MTPLTLVAKWTALLTQQLIYLTKQGKGETAPGLVALKLDPHFVRNTHKQIHLKIIISGTNGKTTTGAMIKELLIDAFPTLITNPTGSNLLRGIATSALQINKETSLTLWEADEAALVSIAKQVKPHFLILTNLFRDQLDRYGEIDTIFNKWKSLLIELPKTNLILNADDPSLAYLGSKLPKHRVLYFGLNYQGDLSKPDDCADAIFCPNCHKDLNYKSITFSHLGTYTCVCGFKKPALDYEVRDIDLGDQSSHFMLNHQWYTIPLSGLYNVYNITAAMVTALELNISATAIKQKLASFKPVFGRQEVITVKDKKIHLFLVKNPTGFNQVLDTLKRLNKKISIGIMINDNTADGTDVSWLWDVDFDQLKSVATHIIVGGERAYDMGVRLKYSGLKKDHYQVIPSPKAFKKALISQPDQNIYLLPTYTAMWQIREDIQSV